MTKQYTFRIPDETIAQLDEICKICDTNRTQWVIAAVAAEYDKLQGNPKMMKIMEQMNDLKRQLEEIGAVTNRPNN